MKKEFAVVAALIKKEDRFLLAQRNKEDKYADLWEFPGGKVEEGESREEAVAREIKEELDLDIEVQGFLRAFEDESPVLKIKVFLYLCRALEGKPSAQDCQDFGFFTLLDCQRLELAPVDKKIIDWLQKKYFKL
ncbi:MAG: (deoxy)nucleoside triphosphate pyrophosphohydrolase [Candidatus Omnitrophica bacterium]|nr:(deoxy)nucleoside triphosphate pyrophosphohydrolase [Candidatus Omnitrophota bacterium]